MKDARTHTHITHTYTHTLLMCVCQGCGRLGVFVRSLCKFRQNFSVSPGANEKKHYSKSNSMYGKTIRTVQMKRPAFYAAMKAQIITDFVFFVGLHLSLSLSKVSLFVKDIGGIF